MAAPYFYVGTGTNTRCCFGGAHGVEPGATLRDLAVTCTVPLDSTGDHRFHVEQPGEVSGDITITLP